MHRIFSNAHRRILRCRHDDERRRILKILGDAALEEHAQWILMHRERSIDQREIVKLELSPNAAATRPLDAEYKYRAFISYSHSDERWAGVAAPRARVVPRAAAPGRHGDGVRRRAGAHRAGVPRSRRAHGRDQSRRQAHARARAVGLPDRDLLAGGGAVALGQRGGARVQAPGSRASRLLPDRRRRARRVGAARDRGPGVFSARADLQARPRRRAVRPSSASRSPPTAGRARTVGSTSSSS